MNALACIRCVFFSVFQKKPLVDIERVSYVCIVKVSYIRDTTDYTTMSRYGSLEYRITARIARKRCTVFVREDFQDLSDYDQVGRALRKIAKNGQLVRLGYGVYAKTKKSTITGELVPVAPASPGKRDAGTSWHSNCTFPSGTGL